MFSKKKPAPTTNANTTGSAPRKSTPSVISADMNVLGNIISDGFLDINGRVEGNVKCDSTTIREHGQIKGDVVADTIQIYGHVEGLVKAKSVHLYASARVIGVIMHESLSIEDGAFVDGKFKRTDKVFIDDDASYDAGSDFFNDDDKSDDDEEEGVLDNLKLVGA